MARNANGLQSVIKMTFGEKLINKTGGLTVCFPFIGDSVGGSVFSALTLAKEIKKEKGIAVRLCVMRPGVVNEMLSHDGLRCDHLNEPFVFDQTASILERILALFRVRRSIWRYLKEAGIDVVHTNDMRTAIIWGIAVVGRRPLHVWHQRSKFSKGRLGQIVISFADQVVCNSYFTLSSLPKRIRSRAVVIDNLFNEEGDWLTQSIRGSSIRRFESGESDSDMLVLGFLGAYNEQKQPLLFIKILEVLRKKLAEMVPSLKLYGLMAGKEGAIRIKSLEQEARLRGLQDYIQISGFIGDINDFFASIDVLFAVSQHEAFGRNIVEAMQRRIPVIASKSGAHPELIKHQSNGFLVDLRPDGPIDIDLIARSLLALVQEEQVFLKITNNGVKTSERFTARAVIVGEILSCYQRDMAAR
jgi:glycosyltransferase involved in cell wall biosynthesis